MQDVFQLQPSSMPDCDILLASPMCTSLSRCNNDPRPLTCASRTDQKEVSGATTEACLAYVAERRPRVVILETVLGRAPRGPECQPVACQAAGQVARAGQVTLAQRQMAPVLEQLARLGYYTVTDVADARDFGLPQSRLRVYCTAILQAAAPRAHLLRPRAMQFPGLAASISLTDCLLI